MNTRSFFFLLCLALIVAMYSSCSSHKSNSLTSPYLGENENLPFLSDVAGSHNDINNKLAGIWTMDIDLQSMDIDVKPSRIAQTAFNVTTFIPPPLIYINSFDPLTNIVELEINIENTYSIDVYDVRLIIYTDNAGHLLLNDDNWTSLFDIEEGMPINPFIAYSKSDPQRTFFKLLSESEIFRILLPEGNSQVQFAVLASWPGNTVEPYKIDSFIQDILYDETGSSANITVSVYDWQNDVESVTLYCPEITGEYYTQLQSVNPNTWGQQISNNTGVPAGAYQGFLIAKSTGSPQYALYDDVIIEITELTSGIPNNSLIVNSIDLGGDCRNIIKDGDYLYAIAKSVGLFIFNVVVPDDLIIVNMLSIPGISKGIAISGEYAYVIDDLEGLMIIDIDPPEAANIVSNVPDTAGGYEVELIDHHAYVSTPDGVIIVDISDPLFPFLVQQIDVPGDEKVVTVDGNFAYVSLGEAGFTIVDVSDPVFPEIINYINTDGQVYEISIVDNYAFVADGTSGIKVFDVTDPYSINIIGGLGNFRAISIEVQGKFAYCSTGGEGLVIVDMRIPSQPVIHNILITNGLTFTSLNTANYSYLADGPGGIKVINLWRAYDTSLYKWGKTWGGDSADNGYKIAIDNYGNIYSTGSFNGTVDFDPNLSESLRTSEGGSDIFLSKFNSDGELDWVLTWGGLGIWDTGFGLTVDNLNNVYVTGTFSDSVDFNPDPFLSEIRTSEGINDIFVSKFDQMGEFNWVVTLGGVGNDSGLDLLIDPQGNIYLTGTFEDSVDFYPGPGEDWHSAQGEQDNFLVKLSFFGGFRWARSWGTPFLDQCNGIAYVESDGVFIIGVMDNNMFARNYYSSGEFDWEIIWDTGNSTVGYDIDTDSNTDIYITGDYDGNVDFDPGPGEDWYESNGGNDVFLIKLESDINYLWTQTWGGMGIWDEGFGLVITDSPEYIYITGCFEDEVDFDPGPGEDFNISNGGRDVFLSQFDLDGSYISARTWGGMGIWDEGFGLAADMSDNIYVIGNFEQVVDFIFGQSEDWHIAEGEIDAYLLKVID